MFITGKRSKYFLSIITKNVLLTSKFYESCLITARLEEHFYLAKKGEVRGRQKPADIDYQTKTGRWKLFTYNTYNRKKIMVITRCSVKNGMFREIFGQIFFQTLAFFSQKNRIFIIQILLFWNRFKTYRYSNS